MGSILDGATARTSFAGDGGKTGATFERAVLGDGTPVVIKHVTPADWAMVVSGGVSHLDRLWRAGVFSRVPASIDHTMIALEPDRDGLIIVMHDVSKHVLAEGRILSREENRRVLEALDEMYREFWEEELPGCPLDQHFAVFTPALTGRLSDLGSPIPPLMRRGWEMFADVAPVDVGHVMSILLDDPAPLVKQLDKQPKTLTHGDVRLHNLGLSADRVVLLDWELAGNAPPAVDFAWYLVISASRIAATREDVIADFREVSGDRFDARALELSVIAALFFLGWNKALDIVENPDPAIRVQERADLDWWVARVRAALETWSPM
jgi:hypothetical protein